MTGRIPIRGGLNAVGFTTHEIAEAERDDQMRWLRIGLEKRLAWLARLQAIIEIVKRRDVEREFVMRLHAITEFIGAEFFGLRLTVADQGENVGRAASAGKCRDIDPDALIAARWRPDRAR